MQRKESGGTAGREGGGGVPHTSVASVRNGRGGGATGGGVSCAMCMGGGGGVTLGRSWRGRGGGGLSTGVCVFVFV